MESFSSFSIRRTSVLSARTTSISSLSSRPSLDTCPVEQPYTVATDSSVIPIELNKGLPEPSHLLSTEQNQVRSLPSSRECLPVQIFAFIYQAGRKFVYKIVDRKTVLANQNYMILFFSIERIDNHAVRLVSRVFIFSSSMDIARDAM